MNSAELAVLGCFIQNQKAQPAILDKLSPDDFTDPELAELFERLQALWSKAGRLDAVLASRLPQKELVARCCEAPASYGAYESYIKAVRDGSLVARAQAIGLELAMQDVTAEDVEQAVQRLAALLGGKQEARSFTATEGMVWFIAAMTKGKPDYISTGFSRLDRYTAWSPGDFVVIGGRPSAGKTAFSLQLALQMAGAGKRVVYYSLETSREKLTMRAATCDMCLDYDQVRRYEVAMQDLDPEDFDRYSHRSFEVVEAGGRTAQWIKMDALRRKADVVIIDYLGLIPGQGVSRYEKITNVSQSLHEMAQGQKLLVIALSQLSRAGAGKLPTMEDLRESGQIEQDADCILLLHNDKENDKYTVRIGKNKEGITGDLPFQFLGKRQHFSEIETRMNE